MDESVLNIERNKPTKLSLPWENPDMKDNLRAEYIAEHAIRLQYERAIEENLPIDKKTILGETIAALKELIDKNRSLAAELPNSKTDFKGVAEAHGEALIIVTGQLADVVKYAFNREA